MSTVFFYHVTRARVDATARMLIEKSLERDWRVSVRGTDRRALDQLDAALWGGDDTFLPHGQSGGAHDADQPVLLSIGVGNANAAQMLVLVDGAETSAPEIPDYDRVSIVFDGRDEAAVQAARGQWKTLTDAGIGAKYWSEESGRWQMKAESAARSAKGT